MTWTKDHVNKIAGPGPCMPQPRLPPTGHLYCIARQAQISKLAAHDPYLDHRVTKEVENLNCIVCLLGQDQVGLILYQLNSLNLW